jgi:hypothetical protein
MRLTKSRDGFIDMGDAALWLVQYPVRQYDDSDSTGRLTAMLTGFSILGNELTERYGPLPMIECEGGVTTGARPNSPDYRSDPSSAAVQWVSIDLLRSAAVKERNVPLVELIDEAFAKRGKVLGGLRSDSPTQGPNRPTQKPSVKARAVWRELLNENIAAIDAQERSGKANAETARRWLVANSADRVRKGADDERFLLWTDEQGREQTIKRKTVQSALSAARGAL